MSFNLIKLFGDVFKPQKGEVVTVMYDLPHGDIKDSSEWKDRRKMAADWHKILAENASKWDITVNPLASYLATGGGGRELPETARMGDKEMKMKDVVLNSTIILAMTEFSATAPLGIFTKGNPSLRIASMPGISRAMEKTSLAADYALIAKKCAILVELFKNSVGADVLFSTGHKCYFEFPKTSKVRNGDGKFSRERCSTDGICSNLPGGEVFTVPNEEKDSKTCGELPVKIGDKLAVLTVEHNVIVDVKGDGSEIGKLREKFASDLAVANIAECAIGCNEKAKVTGNVLEDEKAGFHFAYGRSDHFGGLIGPKNFAKPENVVHHDIVYAKDCPVVCKRFDFVLKNGSKKAAIVDGELQIFPSLL